MHILNVHMALRVIGSPVQVLERGMEEADLHSEQRAARARLVIMLKQHLRLLRWRQRAAAKAVPEPSARYPNAEAARRKRPDRRSGDQPRAITGQIERPGSRGRPPSTPKPSVNTSEISRRGTSAPAQNPCWRYY